METLNHEFKEGDWVGVDYLMKNPIKLDTSHFHGISSRNKNWFDGLELWEPKQGEWCWFWNEDEDTPVFGKFKSINSDCNENKYLSSESWYQYEIPENANIFYDQWRKDWKHCEPFIGTLPSFLK